MPTRLVYRQTVDGLFGRAFKDDITPEVREKMLAVGLDLDREDSTLDAAIYGAAFEVLREHCYPDLPADEAGRLMGRRFLDGYFKTAIGSVVRTILKFLPVDEVVERSPKNLMSGTNFIQATVDKRGPRVYEIFLTDFSTSPGFLAGVLHRMIELAGADSPEVKLVSRDGRALRFLVSWR